MCDTSGQRSLRAALAALSVFLTATCALLTLPRTARADDLAELQSAQEQVQASNQAYDDASSHVEELEGQIDANQERVAQIEEQLPAQRERAADSMRVLYKMQQGSGGLIDLLLSSDSFYELVSTVQYLDAIQSYNTDAIEQLTALCDELEQTQSDLQTQMQQAETERQNASDALAQAQGARDQLQEQIDAQATAEAVERQAAVEAAQAAAASDATFTTESGTDTQVVAPTENDPDPVDYGADWGARIDAYLAGSPLAGHGSTFAEAAEAYGVDPRFSPAISAVESSKGLYCFKPYNAWGWGSTGWSSWDEAIWAHVSGLASGYGGQLTLAAAQKYCPPSANQWYSSVLANMEMI